MSGEGGIGKPDVPGEHDVTGEGGGGGGGGVSDITDEQLQNIGQRMKKVLNSDEGGASISSEPAANPELKAANEELAAANEELAAAVGDADKKTAEDKVTAANTKVAAAEAKIKELTPAPAAGGRRRSKRRHPKKGSRKSKKGGARKSKKVGRSRKNGSKRRAQRKH